MQRIRGPNRNNPVDKLKNVYVSTATDARNGIGTQPLYHRLE